MVNLGTKIEIENIQRFSNDLLASLTTSIILKFAKKLPTLDVPYKAILVLRLNWHKGLITHPDQPYPMNKQPNNHYILTDEAERAHNRRRKIT